MALANAQYELGMASGIRSGMRQNKVDSEADVDRTHKLERQTVDDKWTDDTRAYATKQRAQADNRSAIATEDAQLKLEQTKARIQDEGALDFMYELDAGNDPKQAAMRHNMRGMSKIDEDSVQYDQASKTVSFDADSDGDGQVENFKYNVPQTIDAMERITGKNNKDRFMNVTDGSEVLDRRTGKIIATNPKDVTVGGGRASDPKNRRFFRGGKVFDGDGNLVKDTGTAASGGGRDTTLFNPQAYTKQATDALGKMLGGKYDPSTEQFEFSGGTQKMVQLSRIVQRQAQRMLKHKGAISADLVASTVANLAQDFDEKTIRAQTRDELQKKADAASGFPGSKVFGLGKVNTKVLKDAGDSAVQDALVNIEAQTQAAMDAEVLRSVDAGTGMNNGGLDEPAADGGDGEIADDNVDPTVLPSDSQTAIDWPAEAPPQESFKGLPRGKGIKSKKTGLVWFIGDDGQLHNRK